MAGRASATDPSSGSGAGGGGGASPADRPDAFALVREEIECVTERLRRDIFTEIPALERAAEYFFRAGAEGKRLRSTMLLLMASALAASPPGLDALTVDGAPPAEHPVDPRRRQQRIAEITELIHVASLLHDDVIDSAGTRRGKRSLNAVFGNKVGGKPCFAVLQFAEGGMAARWRGHEVGQHAAAQASFPVGLRTPQHVCTVVGRLSAHDVGASAAGPFSVCP